MYTKENKLTANRKIKGKKGSPPLTLQYLWQKLKVVRMHSKTQKIIQFLRQTGPYKNPTYAKRLSLLLTLTLMACPRGNE